MHSMQVDNYAANSSWSSLDSHVLSVRNMNREQTLTYGPYTKVTVTVT